MKKIIFGLGMCMLSAAATAQHYSMEWCCNGEVRKMQLDCINNVLTFNGVKYIVLDTRTTKDFQEYKVTQNEVTNVETILCYFHKGNTGEVFDTQFSQIFHQKNGKTVEYQLCDLKKYINQQK